MIEMDAFQLKWAEQDRKLDVNIRLNRQLLMAVNMNRVRWPLRRSAFFAGFEALIGLIVLVALVNSSMRTGPSRDLRCLRWRCTFG